MQSICRSVRSIQEVTRTQCTGSCPPLSTHPFLPASSEECGTVLLRENKHVNARVKGARSETLSKVDKGITAGYGGRRVFESQGIWTKDCTRAIQSDIAIETFYQEKEVSAELRESIWLG